MIKEKKYLEIGIIQILDDSELGRLAWEDITHHHCYKGLHTSMVLEEYFLVYSRNPFVNKNIMVEEGYPDYRGSLACFVAHYLVKSGYQILDEELEDHVSDGTIRAMVSGFDGVLLSFQ